MSVNLIRGNIGVYFYYSARLEHSIFWQAGLSRAFTREGKGREGKGREGKGREKLGQHYFWQVNLRR